MTRTRTTGSRTVAADGGELRDVYADIATYYTAKVTKFGVTPPGVDWSCLPTQELRFVQALKLCDFSAGFSLNDLGCGYGALIAFLDRRHAGCAIDYLGFDVSQAMIRRARRLWSSRNNARFTLGHTIPQPADYSVASGIFNVQRDQPLPRWERFIAETLDQMHRNSNRGFSVNFFKRSSGSPGRTGLYCCETEQWARYCTEQFGSETEILEDYGLREFTLIVRTPSAVN